MEVHRASQIYITNLRSFKKKNYPLEYKKSRKERKKHWEAVIHKLT